MEKENEKEKLEEILFSKENNKQKEKMGGGNQKMKSKQEQGITLIALVIMIIILLILAGVTLKVALGENGLLKRAKTTVEIYDKASEKEALSLSVVSYQMGKANNEDEEEGKIGTTLHSRNPGNSAIWDIVTEKNSNTTYGDGWNYVEEGTNIEGYGSARHKWVVNYETGDIIELDSSSVHSSAENSIVSPENLIFSLNSADFDLGAASFGPNTKLYKCEEGLVDDSAETKSRWENGIADKDWTNDDYCYDRETAKPEEFFDETNHAFNFEGHNYFEITTDTNFDITERNDGRILWTTRKWKLCSRVRYTRHWYFFDLEWKKPVLLHDRIRQRVLFKHYGGAWWHGPSAFSIHQTKCSEVQYAFPKHLIQIPTRSLH